MARASARTSPESKAPAKLISIRLSLTARFSTPERAHHRALFHAGARSSGGRGESFEGEVGAEENRDARTAGWRRDRRHHPAEVVMKPGNGGGCAAAGPIQGLGLGAPLRELQPQAGLPARPP